jgi:hypothetical protein
MAVAVRKRSHRPAPARRDINREDGAERILPKQRRAICDLDVAIVQQIFDPLQRHKVFDIYNCGQIDDLGTGLEVTENTEAAHRFQLAALSIGGKQMFL